MLQAPWAPHSLAPHLPRPPIFPSTPSPRAPDCRSITSHWLHPVTPMASDPVLVPRSIMTLSPPREQLSPSVSLPACSAAPPGRILEKTLSPSAPGCPVAMPAGPRGPAVLGPALLSAGGQMKPLLADDSPSPGSSAMPSGCWAAGRGLWHHAAGPTDLLLPEAVLWVLSPAVVAL